MVREADVARGTAQMQRGTQGHVAEPRVAHVGSLGGRADADAWQGSCKSMRTPKGAPRGEWQAGK